jgi:hypothetical protein
LQKREADHKELLNVSQENCSIHLARENSLWPDFLNSAVNILVPLKREIYGPTTSYHNLKKEVSCSNNFKPETHLNKT